MDALARDKRSPEEKVAGTGEGLIVREDFEERYEEKERRKRSREP